MPSPVLHPDVICRENIGGSFYPKDMDRPCAPKACDRASECFHDLCCRPFIDSNTCCAARQFCNRLGDCYAP